jgi:hypothetical protein
LNAKKRKKNDYTRLIYFLNQDIILVGSILKAWMGIYDHRLVSYRSEENFRNQLREGVDLEYISMLLTAIPTYIECCLNCKTGVLGYIENIKLENPRLFDLPPVPTMMPLGHGTCFRVLDTPENDFTSIMIERILLKNDDFILLDDELKQDLSDNYYEVNEDLIINSCGDITKLLEKTNEGRFNELFNTYTKEERRGKSKYYSKVINIYGHYHDDEGISYFFGPENKGYDVNPFPKCLEGEAGDRREYFTIIDLVHKIHEELYIKRSVDNANISLLSFIMAKSVTQLIEYNDKSLNDEHHDRLGVLLKLEPSDNGINLGKLICKSFLTLKENLERFRTGTNVNIIDAKIEKELKHL